jgi:hypothetical protein
MRIRILTYTITVIFLHFGCSHESFTKEEKVILQIESGNDWRLINTFRGIYIQDRDEPGSITIHLEFTEREQLKILNVADSVDFWSLRDSDFIPTLNLEKKEMYRFRRLMSGESFLHLKAEGKENALRRRYYIMPDESQKLAQIEKKIKRLDALEATISHILESKPEYKKLPHPLGRL